MGNLPLRHVAAALLSAVALICITVLQFSGNAIPDTLPYVAVASVAFLFGSYNGNGSKSGPS